VRFGLNQDTSVTVVTILWPDGKEQTISNFKMDAYNEVTEAN
jgi:hypothetical protein